jgi:hypothetical protein
LRWEKKAPPTLQTYPQIMSQLLTPLTRKQRSLATLTRTVGVGQHYAAIIRPELSSTHGRPADEGGDEIKVDVP